MPFPKGNSLGRRFQPGVSGNPAGRAKVADEVRELAQADTPEAYLIVAELMRSATKDSTRLAAAIAVLKLAGIPMNADVTVTVQQAPERPQQPTEMRTEDLERIAGGAQGNLN